MSTPATTSAAIRAAFLNFFGRHGHTHVASGSLIPAGDPSLMFTNAGMVPFKEIFVGNEQRAYTKATSCQKCLRVSGKHNDLEEVGQTARHHTFFEMLGNFSFGDYFKEEAIALAWQLIQQEFSLPTDKLWITVFEGSPGIPADEEAQRLWQKISSVPHERIIRKGLADNFWSMGETGPCGPCTEIYIDLGQGPVGPDDFHNGRIVEIWNVVFMQYLKQKDGQLQPLPAPSVDTGMGLERITAVLQQQHSNYHTDLFLPLLDHIAHRCGKPYGRSSSLDDISMRVIADHARATAMLLTDGIQPSNEGRGYVLRRIMRRAIRHGHRLGLKDLFFHEVVEIVMGLLGPIYPECLQAQHKANTFCQHEEESFRKTLEHGLVLLQEALHSPKVQQTKQLSGETVFKLYDTYGFPPDLTQILASERQIQIDEAGLEQAMAAQRERSRQAGAEGDKQQDFQALASLPPTQFVGYAPEDLPIKDRATGWQSFTREDIHYLGYQTTVTGICVAGKLVQRHQGAGTLAITCQATPLYGESGGQVGDRGILLQQDGSLLAHLAPTQKLGLQCHVHVGQLVGQQPIEVGQTIWACYPIAAREQIRAHHSATHLLHFALRTHLGEHVSQAGSLVDEERLRFDFTHFSQLTSDAWLPIEQLVNELIAAQHPVETTLMPIQAAQAAGAMALFDEKYGEEVRVLRMGPSLELCGGTHVHNLAQIARFLLISEEAVRNGVRRVEGQAGLALAKTIATWLGQLQEIAQLLLTGPQAQPTDPSHLASKIQSQLSQHLPLQDSKLAQAASQAIQSWQAASWPMSLADCQAIRQLYQEIQAWLHHRAPKQLPQDAHPLLVALAKGFLLQQEAAKQASNAAEQRLRADGQALLAKATQQSTYKLLTSRRDDLDGKQLRQLAEILLEQSQDVVGCLLSQQQDRVVVITICGAKVSLYAANQLLHQLIPIFGGRGGGKARLAQAGGNDISRIDTILPVFTAHCLKSDPKPPLSRS